MRLFLAIPLAPSLQARLEEAQQSLESDGWTLDLVPAEKFHVTLHYLGETSEKLLPDLHHDLGACAKRFRFFDLNCHGLGAFPSFEDPRVIWAGIEDKNSKLKELFEATKRVLDSYRLFKLREEIQPHLSLARVVKLKESWDARRLKALQADSLKLGRLPVEEFRLMASAAGRYETIESFKLLN